MLDLLLILSKGILTNGKLWEEMADASSVGWNDEKRVQGRCGHTELVKQVGITYCVSRGGSRLVERRSYYEVKRLSKVSVKNILDFIRNSECYRANFTTGGGGTIHYKI